MFYIQLIGLILVYLVIGAVITCLIARYYNKNPWEYLGNNNTWWFVGVGACAVTFLIACFNFGPALLLPENLPTPEQRDGLGNFFNHLIHGKNAPVESVPTKPLPWATGTWFWWKAFLFYCLLTFVYFWFAFWDEGAAAIRKIKELISRHHDEELEKLRRKHEEKLAQIKAGKGHASDPAPQAPPAKLGFWQFAKWDLLVELGHALLKLFIKP